MRPRSPPPLVSDVCRNRINPRLPDQSHNMISFFFSFFNGELASTNMQIFRVLLPRKLTAQKVVWLKQNLKKNDFIQTQAFDKKYYYLPSMLLLCYNQSKANFSFRSTIVVWRIVSHQFSNLTNYGSSRWDVPCQFTLQIHPGIIQWAL